MVMMEPSQLKAEIVHYSALSAGPNQGLPRNAAQTIPDISSSEHLPPGHHASWLQSPGATLTDSRAGRTISYNHHIYTVYCLHTHHHIYTVYSIYTLHCCHLAATGCLEPGWCTLVTTPLAPVTPPTQPTVTRPSPPPPA